MRKTHIVGAGIVQSLLVIALCVPANVLQAQNAIPNGRTINAIGYVVDGGDTKVDLKNSGLIPRAQGQAEVEAKRAVTTVKVEITGLSSPTSLGSEFLTYVLWAVSPEGTAANLGEVLFNNNGESKIQTTTQLKSFSLFVTAEPYSEVRQPSELLVLENQLRKGTKGRVYPVSNYQLMKRSQYEKLSNSLGLTLDLKNVPLEMYQARNAVDIARARGAEKYAPEIFAKAEGGLKLAEAALTRKANRKEISSLAQQTAQFSEDARVLTAEKREQERIVTERDAAAAAAKAQAEAKAAAEAAEAKRVADLEAGRQAELAAAKEAQLKAEAAAKEAQVRAEAALNEARLKAAADDAKRRADEDARRQAETTAANEARLQASAAEAKQRAEAEVLRQSEVAAANEARLKAQAELAAAKAKAESDALRAKEEAAQAEAERAKNAAIALRAQLLDQFNRILTTRDTTRGLVVTMADVLFDTGKADVRPPTREQLAKLSGILLAHPGLSLEVEGHTDSTGSDELNQRLSEQRASNVRDYLVAQGMANSSVAAKGFGKTMPVAENDNAAGRQKNRRVELVVSGDVIGVKIGQ